MKQEKEDFVAYMLAAYMQMPPHDVKSKRARRLAFYLLKRIESTVSTFRDWLLLTMYRPPIYH